MEELSAGQASTLVRCARESAWRMPACACAAAWGVRACARASAWGGPACARASGKACVLAAAHLPGVALV